MKTYKRIRIFDLFKIKTNKDMQQYEFTPKVEGYTSYTVSFKEVDCKEDACIAVWKSIDSKIKKVNADRYYGNAL